jgi:hypothetical protein
MEQAMFGQAARCSTPGEVRSALAAARAVLAQLERARALMVEAGTPTLRHHCPSTLAAPP